MGRLDLQRADDGDPARLVKLAAIAELVSCVLMVFRLLSLVG